MEVESLSPLETKLLVECVYWRARAAGVTLFSDLPPIMRGVIFDLKIPGIVNQRKREEIVNTLQVRMVFETPATPPAPDMADPMF